MQTLTAEQTRLYMLNHPSALIDRATRHALAIPRLAQDFAKLARREGYRLTHAELTLTEYNQDQA
ncbi:hypothetical protein [Thiolapillus sp.]|uniref:hypothetical protein n=1 Tax=Thiolapillus sp. TaxID=2017437 RepID=UPI003AF4B592